MHAQSFAAFAFAVSGRVGSRFPFDSLAAFSLLSSYIFIFSALLPIPTGFQLAHLLGVDELTLDIERVDQAIYGHAVSVSESPRRPTGSDASLSFVFFFFFFSGTLAERVWR